MQANPKNKWQRTASLLVAAAALASSGCLAVAAGAACGGAAGYAYYQGKVCRSFPARLEDSWSATVAALGDLGMPIVDSQREGSSGTITSRTADGDRVTISFDMEPSRFQAEGILTRVGVRVAMFGDHGLSHRLLDQIALHLVPGPGPGPRPATAEPPLAVQPGGVQQAAGWSSPTAASPAGPPRQTGEPPLAAPSLGVPASKP